MNLEKLLSLTVHKAVCMATTLHLYSFIGTKNTTCN